ncbi:octopamine receptor 1-like [Liolophura sinensis]|uniref:octopamine receptor 1-like n=1 Tax=Liolophura sinensis TaxID=3198878 RepID=UPI003159944F
MAVLTLNVTDCHNLTDIDPYSDAAPTALTIVEITYYTLTVIGNSLLIATVVRRHALYSVSYFVTNLGFKHFTFALVSAVLVTPSVFKDRWMFGHHLCILFGFISMWLAYVDRLTLDCLAGDRYVAVTRSLRYRQILNRNKFGATVAFCWSYSSISAAMPLVPFGECVYCDNLKF